MGIQPGAALGRTPRVSAPLVRRVPGANLPPTSSPEASGPSAVEWASWGIGPDDQPVVIDRLITRLEALET